MQRRWIAVILAGAAASMAWAGVSVQPSVEKPSAPAAVRPRKARPPAPVTRADLAAAYLWFERAMADHPMTGELTREVNKAFDGLTSNFFSGDFSGAVAKVNALIWKVKGQEPTELQLFAESLKARCDVPVVRGQSIETLAVRVTSMYAAARPAGLKSLTLRIGVSGREPGAKAEIPLSEEAGALLDIRVPVQLRVDGRWLVPPGRLPIEIETGGPEAGNAVIGWLIVTDLSNEKFAREIETVAPEFSETPRPDAAAVATFLSRKALLVDRPAEDNSSQFLADQNALEQSLLVEAAALYKRQNPYANKVGDWWRAVDVAGVALPVRMYAPEAVREGRPMPLLIALHGAGGDENMFLDGYGAGRIKALADKHGLLVVSPRTELMMGGANLPALLDAIGADYAIDRSRVYVIGHSMGAMTAAGLAISQRERLAAVACLAGGPRGTIEQAAPLLVIGAELDPLIPAKSLASAAAAAKAQGADIEFRLAEGYGHTLVVSAKLDEAVEWLVSKHTPTSSAKPAAGQTDQNQK